MRCSLALLALMATACAPQPVATPVAPQRPSRIVSLNLCADQYLLALADDAQIAGLTRNARDPAMSAGAARAAHLPVLDTAAETVLAARPDLLLGVSSRYGAIVGVVGEERLVDLTDASDYAGVVAELRQVAAAIGQRPRGEALVRRLDADLARIAAAGRGRTAAHYQRRGYLTGTGTLVDDLMRRAGLVNLATKLGKPPLSQLSLEELVAARPGLLIVDSDSARVRDQGSEMLHHPALAGIPRIHVPQAWTVCGGPAYVQAARSIAAQLKRIDAGRIAHRHPPVRS